MANIAALEALLERYVDITTDKVLELLPRRYRELPEAHFLAAYDDPTGLKQEFKDWVSQSYEQNTYRPWEKTHITAKGLKVRSKSEVIISEKLDSHCLPYRYEQMIYFRQYSFSPDFIILTEKGLKYWEHCGKVNDPEYIRRHKWKLDMYDKMGIVPWKNRQTNLPVYYYLCHTPSNFGAFSVSLISCNRRSLRRSFFPACWLLPSF